MGYSRQCTVAGDVIVAGMAAGLEEPSLSRVVGLARDGVASSTKLQLRPR